MTGPSRAISTIEATSMDDPESDYSPPSSTGDPSRAPEADPHETAKGSVWIGFGLGWLILGPGIAIRYALAHADASVGWHRFLQACMLGLLGWFALRFARRGRSRVVVGIVAAFGVSLVASTVLAMAWSILDD